MLPVRSQGVWVVQQSRFSPGHHPYSLSIYPWPCDHHHGILFEFHHHCCGTLKDMTLYSWTEENWGLAMPMAPVLFTKGGKCGTAAPPPTKGAQQGGYAWLEKKVTKGETVDIVFENRSPVVHPMHLHG